MLKTLLTHLAVLGLAGLLGAVGLVLAEPVALWLAGRAGPDLSLVVDGPSAAVSHKAALALAFGLPVLFGQAAALLDSLIRWSPTPAAMWGPMLLGPLASAALGLVTRVAWMAVGMSALSADGAVTMLRLADLGVARWALWLTCLVGGAQLLMVGVLAFRVRRVLASRRRAD